MGVPARYRRQGLPRTLPRTRKRPWKPDGPAWDRTTPGHLLTSNQRLGSILNIVFWLLPTNSASCLQLGLA